jgi:methionyl-tRNA synthetase
MSKKVLVTTPIYYPNDKLHIGHAYTTSLADAIARYQKMLGNEVYFITGSDEHGQKIEDKAKEVGVDTLEYVTKIVDSFKDL